MKNVNELVQTVFSGLSPLVIEDVADEGERIVGLCLAFGGDGGCWLAEQDAVSQEGEARASVHLSLDQFSFGVDAFGAAVVEGVGQGGVDGVAVKAEAAGEGVQVGQVRGLDLGDPRGRVGRCCRLRA